MEKCGAKNLKIYSESRPRMNQPETVNELFAFK